MGILIKQAATVAMTLAAIRSDDRELWLTVLLLAFILALVTAFWFVSIASHAKKDAVARWEVISCVFGKRPFREIKSHLPSAMKKNLLLRLSLLSMIPAKPTSSTEQHIP